MLLAYETEFWMRLSVAAMFVDEMQAGYGDQCIAELDEFWPCISIKDD